MIMFSAFFVTFLQVIAMKTSRAISFSNSFSIPVCFVVVVVVVVVVFFFLHFLLFHIKKGK